MMTDGDFANYTITRPSSTRSSVAPTRTKLFILDIRKKDAFNKGHIDGAINIEFRSATVPDNLKMLPRTEEDRGCLLCHRRQHTPPT